MLLACLAGTAWGCISPSAAPLADDGGLLAFDGSEPDDAVGVVDGAPVSVDAGAGDAGTVDAGEEAATVDADDAALPIDAGEDSGFDAGLDSGFDAGFDAGHDAGFDAGHDAGSDASVEDAGTDAGCATGFIKDGGACVAMDSCTANNGGCSVHATCTVTGPGTNACACDTGYSGSGTTCAAIDNCLTSNGGCDFHATCTDTGPGTNTCACNTGYSGSGTTCTAVDSCLTNNGGCATHATCTDTGPGTNTCACNAGYSGTGTTCTAVDSCLTNNGGCDTHATCTDTGPGTNTCACNAGYSGTGTTCTAVDSCLTNNGGCATHATCTDTGPGTNTCACNAGYSGTGTTCTAVDSCLTNNGGCDTHATCTDTGPGTNTCACNAGYSGTGTTCTAVDSCLTNNGGCDTHATCTDTGPGTNTCACNAGYSGTGTTCAAVDSCLTNNGGCDTHATCTDTGPGTNTCACTSGYFGNGTTCTSIGPPSFTCTTAHSLIALAGKLGGPGNLDGVGAAARFNAPWGAAYDGAGGILIVDYANNAIRKLEISTSTVTTIAGGTGVGEQDGTGAGALFGNPQWIATDGAGNAYITDAAGETVRKLVLSTGVVTTVAGQPFQSGTVNGPALTAATFDDPSGIAYAAGSLFVADYGDDTVRQIDLSTQMVSTFAGTANDPGSGADADGGALFNLPEGVATDGAGYVYVSDSTGAIPLTKIDIATGFAATLGSAFGQPYEGLSYAGAQGLVVAEYSSALLVSTSTGAVTTLPVGTGSFTSLASAVSDGAGHLWAPDTFGVIQELDESTGNVTNVAGVAAISGLTPGTGTAAEFVAPESVAWDGANTVYVGDACAVSAVNLATLAVSVLAGSTTCGSTDATGGAASFNGIQGITYDGSGNLFVADTGNDVIRQIVVSSGVVSTIAGTAGTPGSAVGTGATALFNGPGGLVSDHAGHLYVGDTQNGIIRKLTVGATKAATLVATFVPAGTYSRPGALVLDGAGNLYVADSGYLEDVGKVVLATGAASKLSLTFGGAPLTFQYAYGIAMDVEGNLYVSDLGTHVIYQVSLATNDAVIYAGTLGKYGAVLGALPATLSAARGLVFVSGNQAVVPGASEGVLLGLCP